MILDKILFYSVLAGISTSVGAILLFIKKDFTYKSLAIFLGLASGVMVAVVLFDMLPSALITNYKKAILGFVIGVIILLIIDKLIFKYQETDSLISLGYLIMVAIAMHDLPEGMAIALGDELKGRTGMVIALGIGIHNIPEGMAIAAPLIMAGVSRFKIFRQTLLIGLITPLGTVLGKYAVKIVPGFLPLLLGLASGIMVYLVLFQLWPEAKIKGKKSRWIGFYLGMGIIFLATFL